jgi:hypothetical protein
VGLAAAVRWEGRGLVFGLASAAGLLVAGTTSRRLALAVVGIVGVVMFLPATVVYFFAGTVGVPVLLLLAVVVLLTIILAVACAARLRPGWLVQLRLDRQRWPAQRRPHRP